MQCLIALKTIAFLLVIGMATPVAGQTPYPTSSPSSTSSATPTPYPSSSSTSTPYPTSSPSPTSTYDSSRLSRTTLSRTTLTRSSATPVPGGISDELVPLPIDIDSQVLEDEDGFDLVASGTGTGLAPVIDCSTDGLCSSVAADSSGVELVYSYYETGETCDDSSTVSSYSPSSGNDQCTFHPVYELEIYSIQDSGQPDCVYAGGDLYPIFGESNEFYCDNAIVDAFENGSLYNPSAKWLFDLEGLDGPLGYYSKNCDASSGYAFYTSPTLLRKSELLVGKTEHLLPTIQTGRARRLVDYVLDKLGFSSKRCLKKSAGEIAKERRKARNGLKETISEARDNLENKRFGTGESRAEVASGATAGEADELVYEQYRKQGYIDEDASGRFKHSAAEQNDSSQWVIKDKETGKVTGTVTIIRDGSAELPSEKIFKEEIDKVRNSGKEIAEVSALAQKVDDADVLDQVSQFIELLDTALDGAKKQGVDKVIFVVNPHHQKIYERLGIKYMAGPRAYSTVNDAPAILMGIDL